MSPEMNPPDPFTLSSLVGRVLDERYEIHSLLGQGAMGAVFRATQIRLRRTVAIKVPKPQLLGNPEFMGRFEREALTMAKVVHENVVQTHDVHIAKDGSSPSYIVMEFVEGDSLEDYIKSEKERLTVGGLMELLAAAARGLDAAHETGIVHRDIKPANIVVTRPKGVPKIMDFGIARVDMDDVFATQDDSIVGTPAYMAPEQIRGGALTPAADIYAFGMMAYRLLVNRFAFDAKVKSDILVAQVKDTPIPLPTRSPHIPPAAWEALAPALAKQPEKRPASASALVTALAAAITPINSVVLADLYAGGGPSLRQSIAPNLMETVPVEPSPPPATSPPATGRTSRYGAATVAGGTGSSLTQLTGSLPTATPQTTVTQSRFPVLLVLLGILLLGAALAVVLVGLANRGSQTPAGFTPLAAAPLRGGAETAATPPGTPPPTPAPGGGGPADPKSMQWLRTEGWNPQEHPPLQAGEELEQRKQEIRDFVRNHIEAPAAEAGALLPSALFDRFDEFDRQRLNQMLERAQTNLGLRFENLKVRLPIATQSLIWQDKAIAVFSISVAGTPTEGPAAGQERGLFESENALRLKMTRGAEGWGIEDVAFEPPLPQVRNGELPRRPRLPRPRQ